MGSRALQVSRFPPWRQIHQRKAVLLTVAGLILVLVLLGIFLIRGAGTQTSPQTQDIPPAQEDEFLMVIALFRHQGGERYYFGAELVNDLRQTPHEAGLYRVERLEHAPDAQAIPQLMDKLHARVLITGRYDETKIEATVYFAPPQTSPPLPEQSPGPPVHFFGLQPTVYHLYAPRGLGHPLQYLQYGLIGQAYFWRGAYDAAQERFLLAQQMLPAQVPLAQRDEMDRWTAALLWFMGYIAGPVQGDWAVAQDTFYRSFSLDASFLPATLGLAQAWSHLGQTRQAKDLLQAALREAPDAWQLYFALAEMQAQQGKAEEALALYDKAITLLSANNTPQAKQALADVYFYRGYFFYQQGDYQNALNDYQTARELGRDDPILLSNLGWTAYLLGDYETAVEASSRAADKAPHRPDLLFNKGLHLLAAGRYDEAQTTYQQAIQLTLTLDDVRTRSTYFGTAYYDLDDLAQRRPDLEPQIREIQQAIDTANG